MVSLAADMHKPRLNYFQILLKHTVGEMLIPVGPRRKMNAGFTSSVTIKYCMEAYTFSHKLSEIRHKPVSKWQLRNADARRDFPL